MTQNIMRKASLALAALAASSSAYAALDMDSRVTQLEQQMRQVRTENAMGTYGAKTAPGRPNLEGGHGFKLSFDILYWHAKVGGTEFAYTDDSTPLSLPLRGRTKDMSFDWDWGFRFGLGYNFEHDDWDILANFTYFNPNASASANSGYLGSVIPLKGYAYIASANPVEYCLTAKSQADLKFDVLDIELGRSAFVSSDLAFRPHFGLKTAWIVLDQVSRYSGGVGGQLTTDGNTTFGLGANTVHVNDHSNIWGLGPRTGVDSKWTLGNGVSIFGDASFAVLFSRYTISHKEYYSGNSNDSLRVNGDMHRFLPTAQLALGFSYDSYVNKNQQHISLSLGYELQYWWRLNQMVNMEAADTLRYDRYAEDAGIQGVTFDLTWQF